MAQDLFMVVSIEDSRLRSFFIFFVLVLSLISFSVKAQSPISYSSKLSTKVNTAVSFGLLANDYSGAAPTFNVVTSPTNGSIAQSGSQITYTPNSNFTGTDTLTFTATNGSGTSSVATVSFIVYYGYKLAAEQTYSDIDGEAAGDESGASVASNIDGTIIAIGAPENDAGGNGAGHVRVYQDNGSAWTQLGSDIDGTNAADNKGRSVALNNNGTIVAIGTPLWGGGGSADMGLVQAYQYSGGAWSQLGVDIFGAVKNYDLGTSVALNADGTLMAVGIPGNDQTQVYRYSGGSWAAYGTAVSGTSGDTAGTSVSLSQDGTILAVGAPLDDAAGTDAGAVRIYQYNGTSWAQLGSTITGAAAGDLAGTSVSLSADGKRVAIGSPINNSSTGQVRIYTYSSGSWSLVGSAIAGEATGDEMGRSVALSAAGNVVSIGATLNAGTGTDAGHVRIYQEVSGAWQQQGSDIDAEAAGDQLGAAVTLTQNATSLIAGAPFNDGTGTSAGHVRAYKILNVYKPIANNVSVTFDEDIVTTVNFDASDADGDSLTYSVTSITDGHSYTISGSTVIITPKSNFNGTSYATYFVNDGTVNSDTATITLNISPVNDKPVANGTTLHKLVDDVVVVNLNAVDTEGSSLTYELVALPQTGTATFTGASTIQYTPSSGFTGTISFTYRVFDGELYSDPAAIYVNYHLASYFKPKAYEVHTSTQRDQGTDHVPLVAVAANYASLTYTITAQPTYGTVSLNSDASATYTPTNTTFEGTDTFKYKAINTSVGILSDEATVHIHRFQSYRATPKQIHTSIAGTAAADEFGTSVAIDAHGDKIIAGAPFNDDIASSAGHARVFSKGSSSWTLEGSALTSSIAASYESGTRVAMSSDGSTVIVTAPKGVTGGNTTGQIVAYYNSGSGWAKRGSTLYGDSDTDLFGQSVSVNIDGTVFVVGHPNDDQHGVDSGMATIYKYDTSTSDWATFGETRWGSTAGDAFGTSVAVSGSGNIFAAGSPLEDTNGTSAGKVNIYKYNGTNWIDVGSSILGAAAGEQFGYSIALNDEGDEIAIAAPYATVGGNAEAGTVRVYEYNGSAWVLKGAAISGTAAGQHFGSSISMSADGRSLVVGIPNSDVSNTGAGQVNSYRYNGSAWVASTATLYGDARNDAMGTSVALSKEKTTLVMGAPFNDGGGNNSGQVKVYNLVNFSPAASTYSFTIDEDITATVTLTVTDADGDSFTNSVVSNPDNATISFTGNVVTYTPDRNFNGDTYFTYKANDGLSDSNIATVTIHINPVNDKPTVNSLEISGIEGNNINGTFNATDPEGDPITFAIQTSPAHGTLTFTSTNTGVYAPNAGFNGTDTFTYYANDGSLNSDIATVTLKIRPLSYYRPTAYQVFTQTPKNTKKNDIFLTANNDGFYDVSFQLVDQPKHGVATVSGSVATYSPTTKDYEGDDSFSFKATYSGYESNVASVSIKVFQDYRAVHKQLRKSIKGENAGDQFGYSVTIDGVGGFIAAGAPFNDESGNNAGNGRSFKLTDAAWEQHGGSFILDNAERYNTGTALKFSVNGKMAAITAPFAVDAGITTGHVLLYKKTDTSWELTGANVHGNNANDEYGHAVALSSNGFRFIASAPQNDNNGSNSGEVSVQHYLEAENKWVQVGQSLYGRAARDEFGSSVAMNAMGNIIAVGAPLNDDNGNGAGSVRIFKFDGTQWNQMGATLLGDAGGDQFGFSIALSDSGKILAVGAPYFNGGSIADTGLIRVFEYNGSSWVQKGSDIYGTADRVNEGMTLDIDSSGNTIVSGLPNSDVFDTSAGQINKYTYNGSDWIKVGTSFLGSSRQEQMGSSLDLSSDGSTYITGCPSNDAVGINAGEIHVVNLINFTPVSSNSSVTFQEDYQTNIVMPAVDRDGDELTYSIVTQPQHGFINISGNVAKFYPEGNYYGEDSFTFKATDGIVETHISKIDITITPLNDAPYGIILSNQLIPENNPIGFVVAQLSVWEVEPYDTITYELVDFEGNSFNNELFYIEGNKLLANYNFDFEGETVFQVRLRATDQGGLSYENTYTLNVTDIDEDLDRDGIYYTIDNCPDKYNPGQEDLDGDGIGDVCDDDWDGDNVLNITDVFPLDGNEWKDTDLDGIGDNADTDDDNDGYPDVDEIACGGNPLNQFITPPDLDGDFIPDCTDPDRDGDGCLNEEDMYPDDPVDCYDTDGDGIPDSFEGDIDNDGIANELDAFQYDSTEWSDLDKDGIGDNADLDDNNDGQQDEYMVVSGLLTPNTGGLESVWKVFNIEQFPGNRVTVIDKNRKVVYQKSFYKSTWKGTYMETNTPLPGGSYYYIIELGIGDMPQEGWIFIRY